VSETQTLIYIPVEGHERPLAISVAMHMPGAKRPRLMLGNEFCGHQLGVFSGEAEAEQFMEYMRALAGVLEQRGIAKWKEP
jgi:hypothetical protein